LRDSTDAPRAGAQSVSMAQAATAVATGQTVHADRLRRSPRAAETERRRRAHELHTETAQGVGALERRAAARPSPPAAAADNYRDGAAACHGGRMGRRHRRRGAGARRDSAHRM